MSIWDKQTVETRKRMLRYAHGHFTEEEAEELSKRMWNDLTQDQKHKLQAPSRWYAVAVVCTVEETKLIFAVCKDPSKATRRSDHPFDVNIEGPGYRSWLPLAVLSNYWGIYQDKLALMSSYPSMVLDGDWSGIRDSSEEQIWAMFEYVLLQEEILA